MTYATRGRLALAGTVVVVAVFAGVGSASDGGKVLLCHGTASEPNPYVLISVDESALNGHLDGTAPGHGPNNNPDVSPVDGACPTTPPGGGGGEE
jgi:hypothetical protein